MELNIDSQPLDTAINAWAAQTGYQVLLPVPPATTHYVAPIVKGTYAPDVALTMLLASTDLGYQFVNAHTVAIGEPSAVPQAQASSSRARSTGSGTFQSLASDERAGDSGNAPLEQVVVTAQKREERALDVPISIVAVGGEELQRRQITNIDDLSLVVPGLAIQSSANRRITLRGISNVFGNASLIGMYLDEADVTSTSASQLDLNTYDLERVEVLRGPQGTLYGQGSSGGTIRFITKSPSLSRFSMDSDVAALVTRDGAPGQRVNAVVNVPVVKDVFGLRIAGTYDHEGGWIDEPAAGGRNNINGQNLWDVRVKGLWQPASPLTVSALAEVHRNNKSTNTGEDANGNYTQLYGFTTAPSLKDDHELYNLSLTYDSGSFDVLSATSYVNQSNDARDYGAIVPLSPTGTPRINLLVLFDAKEVDILTEELRFTSKGDGSWQWVGGAFYRRFEFDENEQAYLGLPAALPPPLFIRNNNLSKSWAVFGDASYKLTRRLTVGAGLRYFEDNLDSWSGRNAVNTPTQIGTFHSVNPRAYVQFRLTDNVNIYTSAAKGFRSGGFNALGQPPYDPETVKTYELGTKMSVFGGAFGAEVALFYSDYTNFQITGIQLPPSPAIQTTSNAGSAWIRGVEADLTFRPNDQWSLSLKGSYADSAFYKINATSTAHAVGDSLDLFPKYEFGISTQRNFILAEKPSFARLDYSQQGREPYRNRASGPWFFSQSDIINMLNVNAGVQWSDSLSFGAFGRNLLNDRGYTDPFSIQQTAARSRPRTFGVEFGLTF
jgi:iron complex outermembrane receptor protein